MSETPRLTTLSIATSIDEASRDFYAALLGHEPAEELEKTGRRARFTLQPGLELVVCESASTSSKPEDGERRHKRERRGPEVTLTFTGAARTSADAAPERDPAGNPVRLG
jgi:hypothetical protein